MAENPLITVYIPCHNYGRFLEQAIESVRAQLYGEWELFIVDDGSSDGTADIGKTYADRYRDRIRFVQHDDPIGLQKTANRVLSRAKGKYIVRLDADDWMDEAGLLALVTRAEMEDAPTLVYGSYYYVNEDGHVIGLERQLKLWDQDRSGINPPHGACTLVRTRSLRAVGGYSEDINAQDGWELWFKLSGRGNSATVTTPVFFYRQHGTSLSRSGERLYSARAKIFSRLRQRLDGPYRPKVLAIVPVRENYPHFVGVPYTTLNGRSALERAIAEAQAAPLVDDVMVSTDSAEVLQFSAELETMGCVGPHMRVLRPPSLNGSHIHLLSILAHAGDHVAVMHGMTPDIVLFLNLHAVLRTETAISKAIDTLLVTESDTVVSIVEERDPVFIHSEGGLKLVGNGRFDDLYHRNEQILRYNGCLIASWWDVVEQGSLWGGRTGFIEMTPDESRTLTAPHTIAQLEAILRQREEAGGAGSGTYGSHDPGARVQ